MTNFLQPIPSLTVIGTDTGVGKTHVGAALLGALRGRGLRVAPYKPVETGCPRRGGRWAPRDAARLLRASGADLELSEVCPFPYRTPVAPALAAGLERRRLSMTAMVTGHRRLASRFDFVLVETAGGLLTPLTGRQTNRDLARALGLPALVVAANRLGVLNHTLLTVEALRGARVPVAAVLLNHPRPARGPAERGNLPELRRLLPGLPVIPFPFRPGGSLGVTPRTARRVARLLLGPRPSPSDA